MRLSSSPYVFSKISDFVVGCANQEGVARVVNYLDDFCLISKDFKGWCGGPGTVYSDPAQIAFLVSFKKLSSPATVVWFVGINIDSICLAMSLPDDKLARLLCTLDDITGNHWEEEGF